ncbi:polyketide cyclase [Micromonospora rosaria]|uniref:Polyketide cyclase n=1 Tax=Micromonospora rosaria TaxID=47874 RepID=A0A136PZM2_9ACTN|nr:SRPBCC family protein [Micromonospora rosaria]KXK63823.1 polyketide cyclase [Micromonospora rosaria]
MAGRTDNRVVIAAPLDLVWDMTNDLESWPTLFGEYRSVEILEREGDRVRFRLTMHPEPDGTVWSWVSERRADRASRTVHAKRIETGPLLEFMHLFWEYREVPGGTELRWIQQFQMKPDAPVDNAGAQRHLDAQTAKEMRRIKEIVERAAAETPATGAPA